jgi:flavin-dependent dehydrogenase
MRNDYDAIIIGGGPAGVATATHLARHGFATLLLDRAEFPRNKPCGEFYSPPVRGLLSSLGAYDAVAAAGISGLPAATLHIAGRHCAGRFDEARHPWAKAGGFSIERRILDAILWKNAVQSGADARSNIALRSLLRNDSGRIVGAHTDAGDFHARIVIGADGGRSRVAREMGVVRPIARLQKIAIVSHFQCAPEERRPENSSPAIEMHVGVLPNRSGVMVCGVGGTRYGARNITLTMPESEARRVAALGAEGYVQEALATLFPSVAESLRGATFLRAQTCGTFGHRTITPIAEGALLVGDAANFIDPFTGEGVYFALRGAELAAETLVKALRSNNVSARSLSPYAEQRRRELTPKYAVCDLVERAIHSPNFMAWAAPRLERRPHLMDALLSVTGDMAHPARLLLPDFIFGALAP